MPEPYVPVVTPRQNALANPNAARDECPMCRVIDWDHVAEHDLPSGLYCEWRCANCGHGTMRPTSVRCRT